MRVLVCGSRHWTDKELIRSTLLKHLDGIVGGAVLAHGDNGYDAQGRALWGKADCLAVRGADKLAGALAVTWGMEVKRYTPAWTAHGISAGPTRNLHMLAEFKPTLVLAFTDDLATSKGTKHMVGIARAAGVPVWVIGHGGRVMNTTSRVSDCTGPAHEWRECAPWQCPATPDLYYYQPQRFCVVCHLVEPTGPLVLRGGQPVWWEPRKQTEVGI